MAQGGIIGRLRPTIDFDILDTYDLRVMRIVDMSDWKHLVTESSYIEVTTPGRKVPVLNYFKKGKINVLNNNNLELSTADNVGTLGSMPDGIYTIKVYICEGETFFKEVCYLRTVNTMLELDKRLISMNLCSCDADKTTLEKYLEAELLLKSAHANTRDGNFTQAICEYEKAKKILCELESCGK